MFPARSRGAREILPRSGRFLLALPMLIYPVLHFVYMGFVERIVPPWIPWHPFWTVFTALTIFAAGLAIVTGKLLEPAAALLGLEILLFCLLIHLFLLLRLPGDVWARGAMFGDLPSRLINAPKDLGMSGACFILAGTAAATRAGQRRNWLLVLGLTLYSFAILDLAALHFVYPAYAPGLEPMQANVVFLLPGNRVLAYLTAIWFIAAIAMIVSRRYAYAAALGLALTMLVFDLLLWVPAFVRDPSLLTGNWLKDLGIIGGTLILAGFLAAQERLPDAELSALNVGGI
jgi:uncharacterized membrane protein